MIAFKRGDKVTDSFGRHMTIIGEASDVPNMYECRIWNGTRHVGDVLRPAVVLTKVETCQYCGTPITVDVVVNRYYDSAGSWRCPKSTANHTDGRYHEPAT